MVGLPGAYAWLAPRVGALGFAGFGLYFLGNALSAQSHLVVEAIVAPEVARRAPEQIPPDATIIDAPLFAVLQVAGGLTTISVDDAGFLPRVGEEMLAVATGAGLLEHQAPAHLIMVSRAVGVADTTAAATHLRAATQVATTGQLAALTLVASTFEATTELLAGRLDAARTAFTRLADRIVASGDPNGEIIWMWVLASVEAAGARRGGRPFRRGAARRRRRGGGQGAVAAAGGDAAGARRARDLLLPWAGQLARTLNGALVLGPVDHFLVSPRSCSADPPPRRATTTVRRRSGTTRPACCAGGGSSASRPARRGGPSGLRSQRGRVAQRASAPAKPCWRQAS